eukprot:Pgem_evm1s17810
MENLRHQYQSQEFKDVLQKIKNMMNVLNRNVNATSKNVLDYIRHFYGKIVTQTLYHIYMEHKQTEEEKKSITNTHHANRHRLMFYYVNLYRFGILNYRVDQPSVPQHEQMKRTLKSSYLNPHCINASGYEHRRRCSPHMIISTADLKVQNRNPANPMTFTGIRQRPAKRLSNINSFTYSKWEDNPSGARF